MEDIHLIIMAGGTGQRFWPWSTRAFPKQFHDFLANGATLLQATAQRFKRLVSPQQIWIVTQDFYVNLVQKQLPWIDADHILAEPASRNTAVCLAYTCAHLLSIHPQARLVITPADHSVQDENGFLDALQQALAYDKDSEALVLLGTSCQYPATGYGYIGYSHHPEGRLKPVIHFVEKPSHQEAENLIKAGNYLWNTGVSIGSLSTFVHNFRLFLPQLWSAILQICTEYERGSVPYQTSLKALYTNCPSYSFDESILAKATHRYVVCGDWGWSDVGTWAALYDQLSKDEADNACQGKVVPLATRGCLIRANPGQLVVTYGVQNLAIVQQGNTLFILPKEASQHVKTVVKKLEEEGLDAYL